MNGIRKLWDEPLCRALRRRIGRALGRYCMIAEGDRVVVGLSGGKDSLLLLHALSDLRRRSPVRFDLAACTVALTGMDVSHLREYCTARDVPYTALEHPIMEIIESRSERSPCSFCANMRRGLLSTWAHDNGFNRLALGHSLDDAVETFFLNLLRAGRARSFQPTAHMTRSNVTVIRPLIASPEAAIIDEVKRLGLPVLETVCPFAGGTERQRVKDLLEALRRDVPDLFANVVNAMENLSDADRWIAAADTGKT